MKKYYLGGYSNEQNQGIYQITLEKGKFNKPIQLVNESNTTYFHVGSHYLATILKHENQGAVGLFDLNGNCLDKVIETAKPCSHLLMNKMETRVYTSNYHEGYLRIYMIENSKLNLIKEIVYPEGCKVHCAVLNEEENILAVVCLGLDRIYLYDANFNETFIDFPKGSGVRHALFDQEYLYCISELSNELFVVNGNDIIQQISILPENGESTGAAIRLSKDCKHLYTSTRGMDLITHFEKNNHLFEVKQYYKCEGKVPRDFNFTEDEEYMIIAYQEGHVECVKLDEQANLSEVCDCVDLKKIVCIK